MMSFFRKVWIFFLVTCTLYAPLLVESASNTPIGWGIPSAKNEQVADPGEAFRTITEKYHALYVGDTSKKQLFLTFDCGYENGNLPKILDILKEKKAPAIFFVTGQFVKENPELLKRIVKEGHLVGNHTWRHPNLSTVNDARFEEELTKVEEAVREIAGVKKLKYMRPPEGVFTERTLEHGNELGYTHVFWSLAYRDWNVNGQQGAQHAYEEVMKRIHPGAILLLHSISNDNTEALGEIIDACKEKGYNFHSLDDLSCKKEKQRLPFVE